MSKKTPEGRRYVPLDKQCWFKRCKNEAVRLVWFQDEWREMCLTHEKRYRTL